MGGRWNYEVKFNVELKYSHLTITLYHNCRSAIIHVIASITALFIHVSRTQFKINIRLNINCWEYSRGEHRQSETHRTAATNRMNGLNSLPKRTVADRCVYVRVCVHVPQFNATHLPVFYLVLLLFSSSILIAW